MSSPGSQIMAPPSTVPASAGHTHPSLGVALREGHYRVIALEPIAAGTELLQLHGVFVDAPSRYSVQVAAQLHVVPPDDLRPEHVPDRYLWRYLNHACRPNAAFAGRWLIALQDIAAWDEINFDYNSTEYEIAEAFQCRCGGCGGRTVRGFKHLGPSEQARLAPYLAPHLAALLPATT